MKICINFTEWHIECDCTSLLLVLVFGILTCISLWKVMEFFKWKIEKEQEFDKTIFANFGKKIFPVGVAQNNNAQNNAATPANGNVQNAGMPTGQQGNLKHDRQGDSKPLTGK